MARNYLLGYGERLTTPITPPSTMSDKAHPYTFDEARERLLPRIEAASHQLDSLPSAACPNDEAVAVITLHPAYLAKSYFPERLLRSLGLDAVGSRPTTVTPGKFSSARHARDAVSADVFVAGERKGFRHAAPVVAQWDESSPEAEDLRKVEDIRVLGAEEKLKVPRSRGKDLLWEVVLHANGLPQSDFIVRGFQDYLAGLDIEIDAGRRIYAEGLCFLPVRAPREKIRDVSRFSFLRVAREMPSLRPVIRSAAGPHDLHCALPDTPPLDPSIRVAVFDGGLPQTPDISRWVRRREPRGMEPSVAEFEKHGLAVTSALLFGPLPETGELPAPYAAIDNVRVLDKDTESDPQDDLFDVLERIRAVLTDRRYDFVNLSIGPDLPIEDDEVHVWTAVLDQVLADGQILACIAAGNGGENDRASGNARIQSPADCVNALTVGASDAPSDNWQRAGYSSIGPGRSPGVVKPDLVSFGGTPTCPFAVVDAAPGAAPGVVAKVGTLGTSFASPAALRAAIGVRAYLGPVLSPLALKALLIHHSDAKEIDRAEVGWGRTPTDVDELITSDDSTAHVVYQGELSPGQWLRAPIPAPAGEIPGMVEMRATFCFATHVDPQDPIHYTRSGLEVVFRPNAAARKKPSQSYPDSKPFFKPKELYQTEQELRNDAHKWETTLHASKRMRGSSIRDPFFDIHYHAREAGRRASQPRSIPYALIVTVAAPRVRDFYNVITRRYRTILEALEPVIEVPVRVET